MYTLLLAVIYLAFVSLGLPDSLLGSAWPVIQPDFGVPVSWAGLVTMIISGGTICSSLLSDRLTKKFGAGVVTAVSVAMTAAALFGFSTAGRFWMLCLWAIPYGLGAGGGRRRSEQLRRAALFFPPDELAALFLGRRHHRQSVHHELCAGVGALAGRLPLGFFRPDRHHAAARPFPAPVEEAEGGRGRRKGGAPRPEKDVRNPRRAAASDGLFRLLRGGLFRDAVGEQLSRFRAFGFGGARGRLRVAVFHRDHGGALPLRPRVRAVGG